MLLYSGIQIPSWRPLSYFLWSTAEETITVGQRKYPLCPKVFVKYPFILKILLYSFYTSQNTEADIFTIRVLNVLVIEDISRII